jgi:NADH-quinone oxidoreductase subunit J
VSWKGASEATANLAAPTPPAATTSNATALGELIYTHYAYLFQAAGLVLLVAMIGAIALTLRQRPGVRRQKISNQNAVQPADVAEVRKVASRGGI